MKHLLHYFQIAFASIGGFAAWFLGGIDGYIYVLVVFIVVDYITGIMKSLVDRNLSDEKGFRGVFKKITLFMLIGITNLIDNYLLMGSGAFRAAVVFFYISNEGISILDNAHKIGLPVPTKLQRLISYLRDRSEEKKECLK